MTFSGANDSLDTCVGKALRHGKSEEAAFLTTAEVVRELEALEPHFDDVECVRALKKLVTTFVKTHNTVFESSSRARSALSIDSLLATVDKADMNSLEAEFNKTLERLHACRAATEVMKESSNVLRFDGEDNDGYLWHHMSSTDLFDTELCKNSKQIDEALALVQQFINSSTADGEGKQSAAAAKPGSGSHKHETATTEISPKKDDTTASATVRMNFIASLVLLLENNPDLLVQMNEWDPLLSAMTRVAVETPSEAEKALCLYYDLAGPKQRFELLQLLCKNVFKNSNDAFVALVLKLVGKLPENWSALTDDAVEKLLLVVLEVVVLAHPELCSTEDPRAEWLLKWFSNLTLFYRVVQLESFMKLIRKISDKAPSSHAVACVLIILPKLAAHVAEDKVSGAHKFVEYIFTKLLDAVADARISEELYTIATTAISRTVPFISKTYRRQTCGEVMDKVLSMNHVDAHARRTSSSLFILGHVAMGSDPREKNILLTNEQCASLDEELVTKLSGSSDESIIGSFQGFLRLFLPLHWRKLPKTVTALVNTFTSSNALHKTIFSMTELVLLSLTVEGWAHVYQHLQQEKLHAACFDTLLDAILELHKEDKCLCNKNELRPVSFALLQRWCLVQDVHAGLFEAATRRLEASYNRLSCPFLGEKGRMWPVLFPVEMYCDFQKDGNPLENTPGQDSTYQNIAFLQTLRAFLWLLNPGFLHAACHPDFQDSFDKSRSKPIALVLDEIMALYNLIHVEERQSFVPPVTAAFGEDSLLYLLNFASLLVLLDPFAAQFLWRDPHALYQRRALRLFCQDRCGVDPVYFVLRFLTSSKGWKRLSPILVSGFQAELKVDVVISVSSFADGEAEPPAFTGTPVSEDIICAIAREAFSALAPAETRQLATLIQCLLYVYNESDNPTASAVGLLKKRTHDEWLAFEDKRSRALSVAALLEANDELSTLLRREGIDCVYLSSLCVGNWLQCLFAHSARSASPFLSSVDMFANNGVALWEEAVAKHLVSFVLKTRIEMLKLETEEDVVGERLIPLTYTTPIPSPLFALLVARPFTINSQK